MNASSFGRYILERSCYFRTKESEQVLILKSNAKGGSFKQR